MFERLMHKLSHYRLNHGLELMTDETASERGLEDGFIIARAPEGPAEATAMESKLIAKANVQAQRNRLHANDVVGHALSSLRTLEDAVEAGSITDTVSACRDGAAASVATSTPELDMLKHQYVVAVQEYEQFRTARKLFDPPVYSAFPVLTIALVVSVALLEALLTTKSFSETEALGYLGGAVTAVSVSITNIAIAFLMGLLVLRYINDMRPHVVRRAGNATLFVMTVLLVFHAALAGYRWHLSADGGFIAPVMLFFVGVFSAGFALFEGYWRFERRPGYRAAHLKMIRAQKALDRASAKGIRKVSNVADRFESSLVKSMKSFDRALAKALRVIDTAILCVIDGEQRSQRIYERFGVLIAQYRESLYRMALHHAAAYRAIPVAIPHVGLDVTSAALLEGKQRLMASAELKRREAESAKHAIREIKLQAVRYLSGYPTRPVPPTSPRTPTPAGYLGAAAGGAA